MNTVYCNTYLTSCFKNVTKNGRLRGSRVTMVRYFVKKKNYGNYLLNEIMK